MATVLKLLVVDDDDSFRLAIKAAMAESGFEVDSCESGEAAIQMIRETPFDVIVLDYRMPGLSGLNVLQWMHEQKMETPVIMLTAAGSENIAVEAMKLGAYDYMAKDTIDIHHMPVVIHGAHERYLFKKEKSLRESIERERARTLRAVNIFHSTLSSLGHVVNNSLSFLSLNIADESKTVLPGITDDLHDRFVRSLNEIKQEMNVISISVRTMMNLSDALCKQIESADDARIMDELMAEEVKAFDLVQRSQKSGGRPRE